MTWPFRQTFRRSDLVLKALRGFPSGSALGPSGLRAQHLLEAMSAGNRATVLEQLSGTVRLLARGDAPEQLAPHLAGARLFDGERRMGESGLSR